MIVWFIEPDVGYWCVRVIPTRDTMGTYVQGLRRFCTTSTVHDRSESNLVSGRRARGRICALKRVLRKSRLTGALDQKSSWMKTQDNFKVRTISQRLPPNDPYKTSIQRPAQHVFRQAPPPLQLPLLRTTNWCWDPPLFVHCCIHLTVAGEGLCWTSPHSVADIGVDSLVKILRRKNQFSSCR